MLNFTEFLNREFHKRKQKNPRYSLRAYAKSLGISVGMLSKTLAGKAVPSLKTLHRLASTLNLSDKELREFLRSVNKTKLEKKLGKINLKTNRTQNPVKFDIEKIDYWYQQAVIELLDLDDAQNHPEWFAQKLKISEQEAAAALALGHELKLISTENGKLKKSVTNIESEESPNLQKQFTELALAHYEKSPKQERFGGYFLAGIDPEHLPIIREMVVNFIWTLGSYFDNGKSKELYALTYFFNPASQVDLHRSRKP